jgi:hypothetical protein
MVAGIISGRWKVTSGTLEFRSVRAADAVHDRANLDRDRLTERDIGEYGPSIGTLRAMLGPPLNPKELALIKCVYCEIIRANPRSYWGVAA